MYKYLILIISIFLLSCASKDNKRLHDALVLAGDNRTELEKVLTHYQNDTLKLEAARFLIENMPYHNSYTGKAAETYHQKIDSLLSVILACPISKRAELLNTISSTLGTAHFTIKPDIHQVKSDFLIHNIDDAFDIWENTPWAKHLNFEQFCEYILPYKVNELYMLEEWKPKLRNMIDKETLDILHSYQYSTEMKNSAFWACKAINQFLRRRLDPNTAPPNSDLKVYKISTRAQIAYGECDDFTLIVMAVMRSMGVPVAIDFTPQWPFRSQGHSWDALLANNGKHLAFSGADEDPDILHKPEQKMAKVFRKTYAVNHEIIDLNNSGEPVPKTFRNPFLKDVTDEYMTTTTIEVPSSKQNHQKYAYLSVFNDKDWIPVCYGKHTGKSFLFEKIGRDIVYLPVCINKKGAYSLSEPLLVDIQGTEKQLKADTTHLQNIVLFRKYYLSQRMHKYVNRIVGGRLEASNNKDFIPADTIYTIKKWSIYKDSILSDHTRNYRYWRYVSPKGSFGNIAELEFYTDNALVPIKGDIIGTDGIYDWKDTTVTKYAVFDGNPLTFFDAPPTIENAWVGMDFRQPVNISKIVYTPRNDDNNISPGDLYELFYWSEGSWISLGRQTANEHKLTYNKVPTNALFWLRDLTKGSEERIFTYENGEQVWW